MKGYTEPTLSVMPYGVHAALCRLLDVAPTRPLRVAFTCEHRVQARARATSVQASLAFLAVPPRA